MDRSDVSVERARRYECHLNTFDLSTEANEQQTLKLSALNEFLTMEQFYFENTLIDVRCFYDSNLLLVYSKQGKLIREIDDLYEILIFTKEKT